MVIQKNGREYTVTEKAREWKVERTIGGVSVVYRIPKEAAPDSAAVERYILDHNEIY